MIIKQDFCLAPFNTFGLEIMARKLSIITSVVDLHDLFNAGELNNNKLLVLSKGSNMLFTDHFEGLVLLNQIWGKKVIKENDEFVFLKVSSGEFWPSLVEYAVDNNWGGIENLTDIPGKVGAAPVQNIGAYGVELKDVLVSLEAFDLITGKIVEFTNAECCFGYRTSIFKTTHKNRYFITNIVLKLYKQPKINITYKPLSEAFAIIEKDKISIADISKKIFEIRNSKIPNPDRLQNAGSFFKNAVVNITKLNELKLTNPLIPSYTIDNANYKIPAAWLIEKCGWKGKRIGNVGTYEKQALILVKYDKATGMDILNFAKSIQKSVVDKFGVFLEMEVNVV
jgi:UDP-N-acetylmuramate dehydrogenase